MTIAFQKGHYVARFAVSPEDVAICQQLRHLCFFGVPGRDADHFDAKCRHLMVETGRGRLVGTMRLFEIPAGRQIHDGYVAQFYDLTGLAAIDKPMIELGRFCVAPDVMDAEVLRLVWTALTQLVDASDVAILFGCTSFSGIDPAPYSRCFAHLAARHLGPVSLRPKPIASDVVSFAQLDQNGTTPMPPLLRSYLGMGGWVGDYAVIDQMMNTLHVFTCLDVSAVPAGRARALRALAQDAPLS